MRRVRTVLGLVLGLTLWAAAGLGAELRDAVVATGLENRQPVGAAESFSADVGRVFAYTRLVDAQDVAPVRHVWYRGGKVMADVTLAVGSPNWRTWSSKAILPAWTGPWLVEVVAADGTLLGSLSFTVE